MRSRTRYNGYGDQSAVLDFDAGLTNDYLGKVEVLLELAFEFAHPVPMVQHRQLRRTEEHPLLLCSPGQLAVAFPGIDPNQ